MVGTANTAVIIDVYNADMLRSMCPDVKHLDIFYIQQRYVGEEKPAPPPDIFTVPVILTIYR